MFSQTIWKFDHIVPIIFLEIKDWKLVLKTLLIIIENCALAYIGIEDTPEGASFGWHNIWMVPKVIRIGGYIVRVIWCDFQPLNTE